MNPNIARWPRWCLLFVDLDGTIRRSKDPSGFINSPEDVELIPESVALLEKFRSNGWRTVGVTNQAGPVTGHADLAKVQQALRETHRRLKGNLEDVIACFHHPEDGCLCRKPGTGMLSMGVQNLYKLGKAPGKGVFRREDMLMVGDRPEDAECAKSAGILYMDVQHWHAMDKTTLKMFLDYPEKINPREKWEEAGLIPRKVIVDELTRRGLN